MGGDDIVALVLGFGLWVSVGLTVLGAIALAAYAFGVGVGVGVGLVRRRSGGRSGRTQ